MQQSQPHIDIALLYRIHNSIKLIAKEITPADFKLKINDS